MDLSAKVVLITGIPFLQRPPLTPHLGSSSGIGEATALKFASLGANVVITGTDELKVRNVAQKCRRVSSKAVLELTADLCVESEAAQLIERTINEFGRLDIVVNHDGALIYHLATDPKLMEVFDTTMNTNVRSVLSLISLAIPYLEKTKGSVVNVSSVAGMKPVSFPSLLPLSDRLFQQIPSMMTYCVAKSALDMITRCLAIELAPKGIRVNSVKSVLKAFSKHSFV